MLLLKRLGFIFLTTALASVSASEDDVGTLASNKGLLEDSSDNRAIANTNSIVMGTDGEVVTFNVVGKEEQDNSILVDRALKVKKTKPFQMKKNTKINNNHISIIYIFNFALLSKSLFLFSYHYFLIIKS